MLIKELRKIIKGLPADADIIMQKCVTEKYVKRETMIAPVLTARISSILDKDKKQHKRLVLMNMKPLEGKRQL